MSGGSVAAAFVSGLIFAIGLGVSGMTQPGKIIGFLDLFGGAWDPSLALVIAAAVAVHAPFLRWMRARPGARPAINSCAPSPNDELANDADQTNRTELRASARDLVVGAAIFGVGWGLGGYCPGPAVVSVVSLAPGVLIFVSAMLVGMVVYQVTWHRRRPAAPAIARPPVRGRKFAG